jgi:hypothetical protein
MRRDLVESRESRVRSCIKTFRIFVGLTVVNLKARSCCFCLDELSGVRVALFGFGLMPNHFHAVLELVLAVAADTGVWTSKYVTSTRAPEK